MNYQNKTKEELIFELEKLQLDYNQLLSPKFSKSDILNNSYKTFFEKSQDAILIIKNGKFIDCNEAAIKILHYSEKKEFLNTHPSELSPSEQEDGQNSYSKANEMLKIALRKGNHRFEWYHKKADGEVFPAEVLLTVISNEKDNQLLYTVWRDITARKAAEKALRESEERYRLISDLTSDYLFYEEIDEAGKGSTKWTSGSFEKITGYSIQEYDQMGGWSKTIHPDDIEADQKEYKKLKKNQKALSRVRIFHKNGTIVWVKSYGHPIWDYESNRLVGIVGAVEDITQRKQAQLIQELQYNIADALSKTATLEDFLKFVRFELGKIMNTTNFFIAFYNKETGMLSSDVDSDEKDKISEWPASESITGDLIKKGQSQRYTKTELTKLLDNKSIKMVGTLPECWLGVPLIIEDNVIGALVVQSYDNPNEYNQYHESIFRIISSQLSVYIRQKEDEKQLIESEESFRGLFHTIGDAIFILDTNAKFIDVNEGVLKMFGYQKEELIGKTPGFLGAPRRNDIHAVMEYISLAQKGNSQAFEFWGKKKNGEIFPKSVSLYSGTYFGKDIIIALARDISEQKKAELNLKEKEEQLRNIFENSTNIFYSHDINHVIKYFSPQVKAILGYEVEEALTKWTNLTTDHPINKIGFENTKRAIETGIAQEPYELELFHKSGKKVWIEVREAPSVENGITTAIVGSLNDITERKLAEEKMSTLNDNLAVQNEEYEALNQELVESLDNIRLMNEELKRAKEKAEESDHLKSAFLANMSHEIRTPMNGILGFTELLKEPNINEFERAKFIGIIEKSGFRLLSIINDLIDLSKVESGQMEVYKTKVDIIELLNYIYNFFKPESNKKQLKLSLNIEPKTKEFFCLTDYEKIYAILINLVKNAIKYSEKGTIEIGCTLSPEHLDFYIKDTGLGIAKDRQKAIFERFVQADISDHKANQGAGLGLTITKAYVELLGGNIKVESEENKGSVFHFTIPFDSETEL